MGKTIDYTIQFYSQWHCGSGTSAGADVDELVIKDKHGMPFIPGKTLKGLVREAAENYMSFSGASDEALIEKAFGKEGHMMGCMHFSNAILEENEYKAIVANGVQEQLYEKITTTAIGEDGIALDHSLRSMETVVPCTLYATVSDVPEELETLLVHALGMIKRMGQKRNRGLGRCDIRKGGRK